MGLYNTPGVYIEEKSGGARPIQAVGTSTAGFLGVAAKGGATLEPTSITNWTQFKKVFGPEEPGAVNVLALAVYGFFQNGGSRCYVVNLAGQSLADGLDKLKRIDEVAIVAAPGYIDSGDYADLIAHCENMKDRVAILDAPLDVPDIDQLKEELRPPSTPYATFYFPWIGVRDPLSNDPKTRVWVPPSGHIAGVWARTDASRGVHKAPANEKISGALDLRLRLTDAEQGPLNANGVNCIRYFPGEGIVVWGARTLEPNGEWLYLNVRRLFNMIEESIEESTRWIVFEPNDETLWKAVRRDVTAFLTRIWRTGALFGSTPDQAFFVKCDAETNPPENIDKGIVTIQIGIAPVKPAEFVVFEISQKDTGAQIAESGG
jgi:uncharacterized protein